MSSTEDDGQATQVAEDAIISTDLPGPVGPNGVKPIWDAPSWEQFDWAANQTLFVRYIAVTSLEMGGMFWRERGNTIEKYIMSAIPKGYTPQPAYVGQIIEWHSFFNEFIGDREDFPLALPLGFKLLRNETSMEDTDFRGIGIPPLIAYTVNNTHPEIRNSLMNSACYEIQKWTTLNKDLAGIGVSLSAHVVYRQLLTEND
jgi:hypothetical protein